MPDEQTVELRHIRGVIGEKENLPSLNTRSSIASIIRAIITKFYGVPQLIHQYGALGLNKTLTLNAGEDFGRSMFSDGVYLYVGLEISPGVIVKIDLATFTEVSTITLGAGEDFVIALFSDGTSLYAGLDTVPGKVVKIDLSTFTKVATVTFAAGEDEVYSLFSDGTSLYAGLWTLPGRVVKVDLATFTKVSTLVFAGGEDIVYTLFSDGVYLYAGLNVGTGKIVKIELSTFTKVTTLTLSGGAGGVLGLFSDGTYLYAEVSTNPAASIVKIDLLAFTPVKTLLLKPGELIYSGIFSDGTYLYVGLSTAPANLAIIDLATLTEVSTYVFGVGEDFVHALFSDGTYIYVLLNTTPAKIIRRYIIPSSDLHQRKIDLIDEQIHSGTYYVYPSLAAGPLLTSNVAAWTKGLYTQVIPVNTVLSSFYIAGVVLYNLLANTEYEIDIATGLAGSEVIIATVVHETDNAGLAHESLFPVPIKVSSSTRISARCADSVGGKTCNVKIRYKT